MWQLHELVISIFSMFSGIIECEKKILRALPSGLDAVQIFVEKPSSFNDLNVGDSIAVNGVCLTLEEFGAEQMRFSVGPETLRITGWTSGVLNIWVNLERSLRLGDRVHGHLVSGHVEGTARVESIEDLESSRIVWLKLQDPNLLQYLWKKGSWAVNGVSLTINSIEQTRLSVCLIPETLKRTNLHRLRVGDVVNIETDWMAKAYAARESREDACK